MGSTGSQCCAMDFQNGIEVVRCQELDRKLGHPRCWRSRGGRSSSCGSMLCACAKPLHFPRRPLVEFEEGELLGAATAELRELSTQERNARLQDLVRGFVLRASAGVQCHIVDAITGYSWPARYTIDGRLQRIEIDVNSQMQWTCHISEIQHARIWQDQPQDDSLFPTTLRNLLDAESLRRLVMLEQKDGSRLCLLEEEASHAEELRVAVSILSLYGREQGSAAQRPAAAMASTRADKLGESTASKEPHLLTAKIPLQASVPDLLL